MTPNGRLRIDIATARYLEALERCDEAVLESLWDQAAGDAELLAAFRELHAGLIEEQSARELATVTTVVASLAEKHLPSGEIVQPVVGPVTVADVARELFQHTPGGLPGEAHQMNDRLRASREVLPESLALPSLVAWAEATFGPAPAEYWKVFRQAAIKVRMRANADVEFQLAARRTPRPEASP